MTNLYRHFNKQGQLLYVGISLSAIKRTIEHRQLSGWFDEVANITIDTLPTREEALEAEKLAIKTEKPLYNIVHNTDDPQGYKDSFVFQFAYAKHLLRKVKTVTAHRVYQELFYSLSKIDSRNGSTVFTTQAQLAKEVGCAQPDISKAIKELSDVGIILAHSRGTITINPKCAWNGKLTLWQEACLAIQECKPLNGS